MTRTGKYNLAFLKVAIIAMAGLAGFVSPAFAQITSIQGAFTGANNLNTSTQAATFGVAPTQGNLLVAICGVGDTGTISISEAGWNAAINESGAAPAQAIFYKIAGASESSTVTCSKTGGNSAMGIHIYEYAGVNTAAPLDEVASNTGSGTTMDTGTTATTDTANELLIGGITCAEDSAFNNTWDNSFTERADFVNGGGAAASRHMFGGATRISTATGTYTTGSTNTESCVWRGQIATFREATTIDVIGSSNLANGTSVRIAIDNTLQAQTTTVSAGSFTISGVNRPLTNQIVTVFADNVADTSESTAVAEYDGAGNITGLVLNSNVLSIGSADNQNLTITNLGQYDFDQDEDIMHTANAGVLAVQGGTNSFTDETLSILANNTLTVAAESVDTDNITIAGALTSTGASTFNVEGNWTMNAGTFTNTSSNVIFDGTSTVTSGSNSFNNIQIGGAATGGSLTTADNLDINGALTVTNNGATTFNISDDTVLAASTVTLTNLDTFTVTNSTFLFDGTTTLTTVTTLPFNNIQIGGAATGGSLTTANAMDINGNVTVTNNGATTWNVSDDTINVAGNLTLTNLDTFTVTNSTFIFDGTTSLTSISAPFNNIQVGSATAGGSLTTANNLDINGALTVNNGGATTLNISDDTINAAANVTLTNLDTFTVANSTFIFDGTTTLTSAALAFNNVQIGTASVGASVTTADNMDINGNLTVLNGAATTFNISDDIISASANVTLTNLDTFTVTNSTFVFDGTTTLTSASLAFNNIQIASASAAGSLTTADNLDINGALTVNNGGASVFNIDSDTVTAASTVNLTNLDTFTVTNSTFIFDGTTTLTSASLAFNTVQIGTGAVGASVTTADNMDINGNLTVLNGAATTFNISDDTISASANVTLTNLDTFTVTNSTFVFDGTTTLTSAALAFNNVQIGSASAGGSLTTADAMDINGALTVQNGGATTWNVSGDVISAAGNVTLTNLDTFTTDASTDFIFDGTTTLTSAGFALIDVQIGTGAVGGSLTTADSLNVDGNFAVLNGAATTFNISNDNVTMSGATFNLTNLDTFTTVSSTVIFDGTTTLTSAGLSFNAFQLGTAVAGASVTTADNLNVDGTLRALNGAATTLNISDDTVFAAGNVILTNLDTFTVANSTFAFDGATTLTSAGLAFNNVQIGGAASGGTLTTADNMDINGALTVTNNGATTLNISDDTISASGNVTLTNLDTFTVTNSTFIFDGTTALTSAALAFNNVQIGSASAGGSLTTADAMDINGALSVTNNGATTFNIDSDTISASSNVNLTNLDTFTVTNSTFVFDGATSLTSAGLSFNHIQIGSASAGGSLTAADDISVDGNLTALNGAATTFIISNRNLTMSGANLNLTNLDTFTNASSTVIFDGTTALTTNTFAFNDVEIGTGVAGAAVTTNDNWTVNGVFLINNGGATSLDISNDILTLSNDWDLTNLDALTAVNANNVFTGNVTLTANTYTLGSLQIGSGAAGANVTLTDDLDLNGNVTVLNGGATTWTISNRIVNVSGNVDFTNLDTFNQADSTVIFDGTTSLTSNAFSFINVQIGTAAAGGSLTTNDNMSIDGTLIVRNGGATTFNLTGDTLTYSGLSFDLTNLDTFTVANASVIFDAAAGAATITSGGRVFNDVEFNDGGGGATWTIDGTMDTDGDFTLTSGSVDLAVNNPALFVAGDFTVQLAGDFLVGSTTVTFDGDKLFFDADGLTNMGTLVIDPTTTMTSNMTCGNLTINAGDTLDTDGYDIDCSGTITINGTLDATDGAGGTSSIFVGRNWTNNNLFIRGGSTLTVDSGSGNRTITPGSSIYNHVVVNAGSSTYTLTGSMNIDGNLTLQAGTLDVTTSNRQISIAGDWNNTGGTFTPRSGTVIFDGNDNEQDVTAGASNYTNILVTNTGTINFTDDWSAVDFTNETPSSALIFDAGSTYVISSDFNLDGQAAGTRILLDSNDGSTRFTLNLTAGGTQTVDYVDVSNSQASTSDIVALNSFRGDNTDAFENAPHWVFPDILNVYTWTGTDDQTTWEEEGNWDIGDGTPGNDGYPRLNRDQAIINSTNHSIVTSGAVTIADLTINTTFTGTLSLAGAFTTDDGGLGEGTLTVNAGVMRTASDAAGNITVDGTATIGSGGTFIMRRTSTAANGTGKTFTANVMIINGSLHADGEGFDNSAGPGAGTDGTAAGGGAHGGVGGTSSLPAAGGSVYGSATAPTSLGSGGGDDGLVLGGRGGGAINLVVTNTLTVNGTLSANGRISTGQQAGGGAGGSLVITAATLDGNGLIEVTGGDGTGTTATGGGGGGGGRIDFDGVTTFSFAGSISTEGGSGGGNGNASRGYAGTIDWPANFDLTIGGVGELESVTMGYDGTNSYNFGTGDVVINSGGILRLDGDPTVNGGNGGGATLSAGDITVNAGGIFSADEMGFDSTRGAGAGSANAQAGGAAYGGVGGDAHTGGVGGSVYGSATAPVNLGSGGGHDTTGNANRGGMGGGALILNVTNTITVDGELTARGGDGSANEAGGASGGTISIIANTLTGSGEISVIGGNASSGSPATTASGGGGGGGRIDFSGITTMTFEGDVTTAGGEQAGSGVAERGYAGTIDWPVNSDLIIGGAGGFNTVTMGYDGTNSYTFDALTINTGGVLNIDGDPTVNAGAGGGVTITATSVTIEGGGLLNANALGFVNTRGSGAGGSNTNASGAGHGGAGGAAGATPGGSAYDDVYDPVNLGSGGGRDTDNVTLGGRGGGAVILSVSTTLTVDGSIQVSGSSATNGGDGGGGSGGSINITTISITGTGDILANGGRAGTGGGDQGGGGAGGRIFIGGDPVNLDFTFSGNITANGGSGGGGGGSAGSQGTIFIDPVISSANDTAYAISAPTFPITTITYTNRPYVTDNAVGNTTDDIRIKIPAGFGMDWDNADTTAIIGGAASAKVSTTVTFEDANKTLVLNVTTGLSASDSFTVSGLSFTNFSLSAQDNLELEVTNDNDTQDEDDKTISVIDSITYTWTGNFNSITWENQGNWDSGDGTPGNDGYPDDFTDVAIISSTNDNITTSGSITVGHLRMIGSFSGDVTLHNSSAFTIEGTGLALNSGTIIAGSLLDINGTMTLDGTLDMSANDSDMSLTGSLTIGTSGLFQKGEGTVTFDGGTTQVVIDNSTGQDLGRVRISVGAGNTTLELASSLIIEKLRIDNAQTLDVNASHTLTLTGTGVGNERPFRVNGNFTPALGTVAYTGLGETEVEATTYYTLTLTPTGTTTYHLGSASAQTIRTDGALIFGNGTDDVTIMGTTYNPDLDVRGNFTITASTIYGAGSGITTFNRGALQTFTDNTAPDQNLGIVQVSANGTDTILSLTTSTMTKLRIDTDQLLTFGPSITLTGTGTGLDRPLINDGSFAAGPNIVYIGDGDVEVEGMVYNTLQIIPTITADRTYTTNASILTGVSAIQPQNTTAFELSVVLGGNITFSNAHTTFGNGSATAVLDTSNDSYAVTSNARLTIDLGGSFNANNSTVILNSFAFADPFVVDGTFNAGTSFVIYQGQAATNITPVDYYNLGLGFIADIGASRTYTATGDFTVGGSLTVGNAASTNTDAFNASNRTITLTGTGTPFVISAMGVFNEGTSRITYTGTGFTVVTSETYYNLTVAPAAANVTHTGTLGTIAVTNDLTIGDGVNTGAFELNTNDTVMDVAGDVVISTTGTLIASDSAAFNVAGSWTNSGNGTFIHNNGTVTFDSSDAETITSNDSAFFHVEFDDSGAGATWQVAGTLDVNGTFLVTEGTVDLAANDPLLYVAGNFTIQTSGTFLVGTPTVTFDGDLIFTDADELTNMGTLFIDPTTTMATDMVCNNLTIDAGDTLVTDGYDIDCSGTITINGTLDATDGTDGRSTINVGRNWVNNNLFISGNSQVILDSASGTRTVTSGASAFYDLTFNGGATWTLLDNMSVDGTLRLTAGTVDVTASDRQISLAGNWINTGATFTPQNGTVIFDGTVDQQITAGASNFWNILVTNAGTLASLDDYSVENFTNETAGSTLIFDAGSTYVINGLLTLDGQSTITRITLNSSDDTTRFTFDVGAANAQFVYYVDVSNSQASGSDITAFFSFDRDNNDSGEGTPQWVFPAAGPLRGAVMVVD